MPEFSQIAGAVILALVGVFIGLVLVAGLFMMIGARLAGVRKATFGKAIVAAIAASFIAWLFALVCSVVPVIGTIVGFVLGLLFSVIVIKAVFDTTFGKALLTWIFNVFAQVAALIIIALVLASALAHGLENRERPRSTGVQERKKPKADRMKQLAQMREEADKFLADAYKYYLWGQREENMRVRTALYDKGLEACNRATEEFEKIRRFRSKYDVKLQPRTLWSLEKKQQEVFQVRMDIIRDRGMVRYKEKAQGQLDELKEKAGGLLDKLPK